MAELGLAIAGVAGTGGALAKALYGIYHSARDACKDAREIASRLELLKSVLLELKEVLRKRDDICSDTAESTITEMLDACRDTFEDIERLTSPLILGVERKNVFGKLAWHFKRQDVRLHVARLDFIRDSIALMVSIQILGSGMSRRQINDADKGVPLRLQRRLSRASQSLTNQRKTLVDLRDVEQQSVNESKEPAGNAATISRLGQRISEAAGLNDDLSGGSSSSSSRNSALLSVEERSITGSASNDVDALLDLWTNLSEIRSEGSLSTRDRSISTRSSHRGSVRDDDQARAPKSPPELNASRESGDDAEGAAVLKFATVETVSRGSTASETSTVKDGTPRADGRVVTSAAKKSENHLTVTEMTPLPSPRSTPSNTEVALADTIGVWLEQQDYSSSISDNDGLMNHPGPFSDIPGAETVSSVPSSDGSIPSSASACDPRRIKKLFRMGNKLMRMKKNAQALPLYKDVYKERKNLDPIELCELEHYIAVILAEQGNLTMAEQMFRKSLSRCNTVNGVQTRLPTKEYFARTLSLQHNWTEAASIYSELWASQRMHVRSSATDSKARDAAARIGQDYSRILNELERHDDALVILEELHRETLAAYGKQEHHTLANTSLQLGRTYRHLDRLPEAKSILENILTRRWETNISVPRLHGSCKRELAIIAYEEAAYEDALQLAKKAKSLFPRKTPDNGELNAAETLELLECKRYIALCQYRLGNLRESANILQIVSRRLTRIVSPGHKELLQTSLDRAEVHSSLREDRMACEILEDAYSAATSTEHVPSNNTQLIHLSKRLGPLILSNSTGLEKQEDRMKALARAATVYGSLYEAQKSQLGANAPEVLQTGHEYGCIYSWMSRFPDAELILAEVWSGRNQALGENDARSVETGLQLSHVYFRERKHRQAFALVGSLHSLQLNHFGPQSIQMVETAELMGYYNLSGDERFSDRQNGLKLLRDAVSLRQEHHGPSRDTCLAAVKLAVLEASSQQLENSAQLLDWVFRNGGPQAHLAETETRLTPNLAIHAGISASGLTFINRGKRAGNALLQEVVNRAETELGKMKALTQSLVYSQAALYFMQGDTAAMVEVLRMIYHRRKRLVGKHTKTTGAAARLLTLGLIADAVLSGKPIPAEADLLQAFLMKSNASQGTSSIQICLVLGILLMVVRLPSLGLPILKWVYRIHKHTLGRLHSETLTTLIIIHALSGYNLYRRIRGSASKEGTARDPRVTLNNLWTRFTLRIHQGVYQHQDRRVLFLDTHLSNWFIQTALIKRFYDEMAMMNAFTTTVGHWQGFMMAYNALGSRDHDPDVHTIATSDEDSDGSGASRRSDDTLTLGSGDPSKGRNRRSRVKSAGSPTLVDTRDRSRAASPSLSEIFGNEAAGHLASFEGSLVDLAEPREAAIQRADDTLHRLQAELVGEVVSDDEIVAATSNIDTLEEEAGLKDG